MKLKKFVGNSVNNIVLDTNVLVSGIIIPYGNPAKILNLILNGNLIINADARILTEYERVLKSPKFSFPPDQIKIIIQFIFHQCSFIVPLPIKLVVVDEKLALEASRIKAKYPLSYADAFAVTLAQHHGIPVITGDPEFSCVENLVSVKWL